MLQNEKERIAKEKVLSKINSLPPFAQLFFVNNDSISFTTKHNYYITFVHFLSYVKDLYELKITTEIPPFALENLSLEDINKYKNKLLEKYSDSTVDTKINSIKGIFNYLYKNKIINTNIMSQVIVINHKNDKKLIKEADINSFISSISSISNDFLRKRNLSIASLIIDTGLSIQDVVALNIYNIKNDKIVYESDGNVIQYLLNPETIIYLEQYIDAINIKDENMPLFISTQNSRISDAVIQNIFSTYANNLIPSDFQSKPNVTIKDTHNYILIIKPRKY